MVRFERIFACLLKLYVGIDWSHNLALVIDSLAAYKSKAPITSLLTLSAPHDPAPVFNISVAYPDPFSLIPALRLLAVLTTRLQRIAIITNHPSIKMASHAILLFLLMPVPLYTNPKTKNAQMAMTFQVVKDFLRRPATTTFEAHQADLAPAPDAPQASLLNEGMLIDQDGPASQMESIAVPTIPALPIDCAPFLTLVAVHIANTNPHLVRFVPHPRHTENAQMVIKC
ncbi:hypothetical protein PCASD_08631 [Puccinia coronata f. sp. avenae]|uniref:Uncharacterized protein n=1 Tax=Puccinia coronata f. sp. avenae TaxID=200324 RepID=A0A2N5V7E2_9BASI|nr:hypothetical protein PCASD_08631 [Puccinia coronata f. sp. avenae]